MEESCSRIGIENLEKKSHTRHVRFSKATKILFHPDKAPVVRYGNLVNGILPKDSSLEHSARGLSDTDSLVDAYIEELIDELKLRGIEIRDKTLYTLQHQVQFLWDLEVQANLIFANNTFQVNIKKENKPISSTILPILQEINCTNEHSTLLLKNIQGYTDKDYVFGKRFLSVGEFVSILNKDQLKQLLNDHNKTVSSLSEIVEKIKLKKLRAPAQQLQSGHPNNCQKPLSKLSIKELIMECNFRNINLDQFGISKCKKKKPLITILQPYLKNEFYLRKAADLQIHDMKAIATDILLKTLSKKMENCIIQVLKKELALLHLSTEGSISELFFRLYDGFNFHST